MDSECVEMDLSTRPREPQAPDSCKVRVAKSVFSIRSLVDLGDGSEKLEDGEAAVIQCGELFFFLATHASHNVSLN